MAPAVYLLYVRAIVLALVAVLAVCVLPMIVLIFVGLIRRFQIARTRHALDRMGFVGNGPFERDRRRLLPLVGAGVVGVVGLIVATLVLPGPLAGRILASTEGSPFSSAPTHTPVVQSGTNSGTHHTGTPSEEPATTHGGGGSPASPASSDAPTAHGGSDAGAPSTVTAQATSATAIQLQWAQVSGATGYHVERSTDTVNWEPVARTSGGQTRYTDAALDSGTTYYYRVAAVVGDDVAHSEMVSATTTVDTPAAPVLISATGSGTSVGLLWSDVEGDAGYRIERSTDETNGWTPIGSTLAGVTSYTDTGLEPATTYYYRVVAVTSDGVSSTPSGALPATTGLGESSSGSSTSVSNAGPALAPTGP